MAKMKGGGAAVKGTSYQNEFPQPDVYTMPVVRKKELPPRVPPGMPRVAAWPEAWVAPPRAATT